MGADERHFEDTFTSKRGPRIYEHVMLFLMRLDARFGACICLLLGLQFSKALKDLLAKLGTITALQFFYKTQFELHSYFILIKLSNILFKLMFIIYYSHYLYCR